MQDLLAALVATLGHFDVRSLIDVLVVAFLLYWLLILLRGTTAVALLRALVTVYLLGFAVSAVFQLTVVSWLLRNSLPAMLVALPILFQPELRRVLERMGRGLGSFRPGALNSMTAESIDAVTAGSRALAQRRIGALMVLERETGLQDYVEQGVKLDALLSSELLVGLFHTGSPFHDGGVVLRRGRIVAVRCVLPLSENIDDHMVVGMRHRAALGISERTDAIAVAVSEERGTISVAVNGHMTRLNNADQLRQMLLDLYSYPHRGRGRTDAGAAPPSERQDKDGHGKEMEHDSDDETEPEPVEVSRARTS